MEAIPLKPVESKVEAACECRVSNSSVAHRDQWERGTMDRCAIYELTTSLAYRIDVVDAWRRFASVHGFAKSQLGKVPV